MEGAKFVDVGGIRTRYFDEGSGEALVLVHGGQFGSFSCALDWDLNFSDLARDHRVIAMDKIGQGHTDNPRKIEDYVIDTAVEHAYEFIKALGLGPVHLVGHSRGGYAVARIALAHPEIVRSLTIVDSGSLMHESSPFYAEVERASAKIDDIRERYLFEIARASYGETMVSDAWIDDLMMFVTMPKFAEARQYCHDMRATLQEQLIRRQRETREAIAAGALKELPVLLIWAYNDSSAPIEECGIPALHLILRGVPHSRMYIFNESDHYVFREKPAEFNATLRTFLSLL